MEHSAGISPWLHGATLRFHGGLLFLDDTLDSSDSGASIPGAAVGPILRALLRPRLEIRTETIHEITIHPTAIVPT
jgi:hypothetical protein